MATQTSALPTQRADIFKLGLKDAKGKITFLLGSWGAITLERDRRVKYYFELSDFPKEQRSAVMVGYPVKFDADPWKTPGTPQPEPKVSAARLLNFNK